MTDRIHEIERLRSLKLPTIPTTVDLELRTNPFLRPAQVCHNKPYYKQKHSCERVVAIFFWLIFSYNKHDFDFPVLLLFSTDLIYIYISIYPHTYI